MIQLLQRFYDVDGGSISVDGKDLKSYAVPEVSFAALNISYCFIMADLAKVNPSY